MKVLVAQSCPTLCDSMGYSLPVSSIQGFSRQEYWSELPFPSSGALPDPGIEPGSPALQADSLLSEPPGKPQDELNMETWRVGSLLRSSLGGAVSQERLLPLGRVHRFASVGKHPKPQDPILKGSGATIMRQEEDPVWPPPRAGRPHRPRELSHRINQCPGKGSDLRDDRVLVLPQPPGLDKPSHQGPQTLLPSQHPGERVGCV